MRNSIITTASRLPKPLRWSIYAVGGCMLIQVALAAMTIASFVIGLLIKGALVLTIGAVALLLLRKR